MRVNVRLVVLAAAIVLAGGGVVCAANASDAELTYLCRIGAPASLSVPRVPPTGRVHVVIHPKIIGCGGKGRNALELVGYRTSTAIYFSADLPQRGISQGVDCKREDETWSDRCPRLCFLNAFSISGQPSRASGAALATGEADATVASVEIEWRREGHLWRRAAILAHLDGALANSLGQTDPIAVFAAQIPCVPRRAVRATAYDGAGKAILHARVELAAQRPCHAPRPEDRQIHL